MFPKKFFKLLNCGFLFKIILTQSSVSTAAFEEYHKNGAGLPKHPNGNFRHNVNGNTAYSHDKGTSITFDLFKWRKGSSLRSHISNMDKRFRDDSRGDFKNGGSTSYGRSKNSQMTGNAPSAPSAPIAPIAFKTKASKTKSDGEMTQNHLKYLKSFDPKNFRHYREPISLPNEKHNIHDNSQSYLQNFDRQKRKSGLNITGKDKASHNNSPNDLFAGSKFSPTAEMSSKLAKYLKNGNPSDAKSLELKIAQSGPTRQTKHSKPSDVPSGNTGVVETQTASTSSTSYLASKSASTKTTIIGASVGVICLGATASVFLGFYKFWQRKDDSSDEEKDSQQPGPKVTINEFMSMPDPFELEGRRGCHNAGRAYSAHARMFKEGIHSTFELSETVQESEDGFFRDDNSEDHYNHQPIEPVVARMLNRSADDEHLEIHTKHAMSHSFVRRRSPDSCFDARRTFLGRRATVAAENVGHFYQNDQYSRAKGDLEISEMKSESDFEVDAQQPSLLELRLSTNCFGDSFRQ